MKKLPLLFSLTGGLFLISPICAQVDYDEEAPLNNRSPWNIELDGIDSIVGGWFYNLGLTGVRIVLDENRPKTMLVKYVWDDSPSHGLIQVNDIILGTNEGLFINPHVGGYGMEVFGAKGPAEEFATALDNAQSASGNGMITFKIERNGEILDIPVDVGQEYGAFSSTFPMNDAKSEKIISELIPIVRSYQNSNGSFGAAEAHENMFGALSLLNIGGADNLAAVKKCAEYLATRLDATNTEDEGLPNWQYCAAALVLSEYYLATGEQWVKPELQEIYDFLISSQYTNFTTQYVPTPPEHIVNEEDQEEEDDNRTEAERRAFGGWGHNPGFEGYGPIAMPSGQGALALAMIQRCGISIDRTRHDAVYEYLRRATSTNGYIHYVDVGIEAFNQDEWADLGRTGASAIAHWMSNYQDTSHHQTALFHATFMGNNPQSFPDTHACPPMGMGFQALGTFIDSASFRKLMDANKWWFTLAHTHQKSMFYQPARDVTPSQAIDSRGHMSAITLFMFTLHHKNLYLTGKRAAEGYDEWATEHSDHLALLDPYGDFEGDGKRNLAEFQDKSNPISDASIISIDPTNIKNGAFTYTRKPDGGEAFKIYMSFNLSEWAEDTNATQSIVSTAPDGTETISVQINPLIVPLTGPFFAQVKIR